MSCVGCEKPDTVKAVSPLGAKPSDRYVRYPIEVVNYQRRQSTDGRRKLLDQCIVKETESSVVYDRQHPAWLELEQTKTRKKKITRSFLGVTRSIFGIGLLDIRSRSIRRSVCQGCDEYNNKRKSCNICGCVVALKIRSKHENCPLGKW